MAVRIPSHLELPAELGRLDELREHVSGCAVAQGFGGRTVADIELAVTEVFVNICNYAYAGGTGTVQVACWSEKGRFVVEVADAGGPFNILSTPPPDLSSDIATREAGGLGVFLVKALTDEVHYQRRGERNIVTMTISRDRAAGGAREVSPNG